MAVPSVAVTVSVVLTSVLALVGLVSGAAFAGLDPDDHEAQLAACLVVAYSLATALVAALGGAGAAFKIFDYVRIYAWSLALVMAAYAALWGVLFGYARLLQANG